MTPAQANHQRRIRAILALRAAAVVCVAWAMPYVGMGFADLMQSSEAQHVLNDKAYAWTERVLILLQSQTWSEVLSWLAHYGSGLLLLVLAAYLWFRRPELLLRTSRPEARR